jgi:hypothetical protein
MYWLNLRRVSVAQNVYSHIFILMISFLVSTSLPLSLSRPGPGIGLIRLIKLTCKVSENDWTLPRKLDSGQDLRLGRPHPSCPCC